MELKPVRIENPDGANVIVGQTHVIKTAEDLYEAVANSVPKARFGVAFCEASGPCLMRVEGNDGALQDLAARNALSIGSRHVFVVILKDAVPINVIRATREVPEVVTVSCATSNPVDVLVAETDRGRGVIGVIDGGMSAGIETVADRSGTSITPPPSGVQAGLTCAE